MKTRSIIAALLLLVAGLQTTWAQGFRVYKSDGTVAQFSMRADSIVFYDGIGSDMDFGPYTPVNQCIAGTWYETYDKSITFGEDGTTDYIAGATYKFLPYQGTVIFYNAAGNPINILKVHDLTANQMVVSAFGSSVFHVLTKTQPAQPVSVSCAQAVELTNALEDGATSEQTYSVTGYITEVVGSVSRNQQIFWMADTKDGGKVFEAYWAYLPEGVDEFKAGMKVTITGKLTKYVNSAGNVLCEIKNAEVVILENASEDTPVETSITCAKAVELTNALEDGATSEETYSVTGYITEVVGNVSRNQQTFWMADTKDGGKVFEAYWANLPEGVAEFTVGMKVTITGQLMKYVKNEVVTPEIKNADVVILENGEGGGDQPGGDVLTGLVNGGFESWMGDTIPTGWKSASSASSAILIRSDEARSGNYSCQIVAGGTYNRRLATQEITLEAGTYTFSFYAKSTTADICQTRAGYVPVTNGLAGSYKYGSFVDINNSEWTLVTYEFELPEQTTLCLLVMNPKNSNYSVSQDILVDDASLTLVSGGGGDTPIGGTITCAKAVELTNALADGATSEEVYTIEGYITEVISSVSRNQQSFWMADTMDGGKVFEAYWANLPEGVAEFTVGMKVTITGQLMKYVRNEVVTPEIKNAEVVVLEGGDGGQGGDQPGPGGDTLSDLENGGFETWLGDTIPTGWKSASTASSAVLRKSTDAHNGAFACQVVAGGTQNKRLATQEITLEAGTYTFSFYAKSTTDEVCQTRAGYVPVTDGAVDIYRYGDYANINNTEWTLVTYSFELTEQTTLCLLVMNPKNSSYSVSQDILVDDAELWKE